MKSTFTLPLAIVVLMSCTLNPAPGETQPAHEETGWRVYDSSPDHLWNRLFRQFYSRAAGDGSEYGRDELDPLLWPDTEHLLQGESHEAALRVLDEFLATHGEQLIAEPIKRALLQRDLWAVFDWLASQPAPRPSRRAALKERLAQVIQRLALTEAEILSLPDNYGQAIDSRKFPPAFQTDQPETPYLPPDLLEPDGAWMPMGRANGPAAMSHTDSFPFFGRSVFMILFRLPEGRPAAREFFRALNDGPEPLLKTGAQVALVRRMLLIDRQGKLVLSPLIETVQLRHFGARQTFYELELGRDLLFNPAAAGFHSKEELFLLFFSHGDVFEGGHGPALQAEIPDICLGCHFNRVANTQSILSYSRANFPLPGDERPILTETAWPEEAQAVMDWKIGHSTWRSLSAYWALESP